MTEQDVNREVGKLQQTISLYRTIADNDLMQHVSFVHGSTLYMKSGQVEERRAVAVAMFGPDKLERYYPDGLGDGLAMSYAYGNGMRCVYFDPDIEGRLQKISGGTCRVEEQTRTESVVVCDA